MKKHILILIITVLQNSLHAQELKKVYYQDGNQKLSGLITSNVGQNLPGVLILPAWKGIDNESKTAALELEKQGYIAFIADIYGDGNIPKDNTEAAKISAKYKNDYKAYQHRIGLALDELIKAGGIPNKTAVIGYCFGGAGALEVARSDMDVSGVVCIHGSYAKSTDRQNKSISSKVLVEHAANDTSISKTDYDNLVVELNEGEADWQIITYANSAHTFTNPESNDFNPTMANRAWNHTLMFLKEVLK